MDRRASNRAGNVEAESTSLSPSLELRASRFDLVSRLADDLAHEIKNPLHAMVINLEVLRRKVAAGAIDAALERTDVIEHELQRVHRLIDQVLQLLRPDRGGPNEADLRTVLEDVVPLIAIRARAARLAFRHEPAAADIAVPVRPESLKLALLALSAALVSVVPPDGGEIVVRCAVNGATALIAIEAVGAGVRAVDQAALADALAVANALLGEADGSAELRDRVGEVDGFALVLELRRDARA
jgi:signal transduction histidine kinase